MMSSGKVTGAQDSDFFHDVIGNVIAPFLIAYVGWVLQESRRIGVNRLYFVARDGQIIYRLAQHLSAGASAPELRYLYGSRRAWLLPSVSEADQTWRRLVVTPAQSNNLTDICGRLGLEGAEVDWVATFVDLSDAEAGLPLTLEQANALLDRLLQVTEVRALLMARITASRVLANAYFEQEGLFDGTKWALVDAGWSLNCQAALKRIFTESEHSDLEPCGFYIGLARDHLSRREAGLAIPMLPAPGSIFSRRRVILEHCFTPATHASTRGYAMEVGRITPTLSAETRTDAELEFARQLQQVVLNCAAYMVETGDIERDFDSFRDSAVRTAADFITKPKRSDVATLVSLQAIADLRHEHEHRRPLCIPLSWRDIAQVVMTAFSSQRVFQQPVALWLEGAAALSSPSIRLMVRTMLAIDGWRNRLKSF